jgi:23S rRNA (cytidine1920-2'-O)/16S rRNA (cytidine1409-2'-O)-methyltransferase
MTAGDRLRADQLLVVRGLAESRTRAQALIAAGLVEAEGRKLRKASEVLLRDCALRLTGQDHPWVSRGGVKLAHALDHFAIDPSGAVCLDIGASTGGFSEVLLARGAARVHAVDVGHDQLAEKLREDRRVVVLERTNARYLSAAEVPEPVDLLVCDASFISLTLLLSAPLALVRPGGRAVVLVKPQFEVGRAELGKGGVVRNPALQDEVCRRLQAWFAAQPGWQVLGLVESPILGPRGNREFLLAARRDPS